MRRGVSGNQANPRPSSPLPPLPQRSTRPMKFSGCGGVVLGRLGQGEGWESRTALRRPTFPPPPCPLLLLRLFPLLLFLLSSEPLCVTPTLLFCCLMPATPPSRGGGGRGLEQDASTSFPLLPSPPFPIPSFPPSSLSSHFLSCVLNASPSPLPPAPSFLRLLPSLLLPSLQLTTWLSAGAAASPQHTDITQHNTRPRTRKRKGERGKNVCLINTVVVVLRWPFSSLDFSYV